MKIELSKKTNYQITTGKLLIKFDAADLIPIPAAFEVLAISDQYPPHHVAVMLEGIPGLTGVSVDRKENPAPNEQR